MRIPFIDYELFTDVINDIKNPQTEEESQKVLKTKSRSCTIMRHLLVKSFLFIREGNLREFLLHRKWFLLN